MTKTNISINVSSFCWYVVTEPRLSQATEIDFVVSNNCSEFISLFVRQHVFDSRNRGKFHLSIGTLTNVRGRVKLAT